MDISIKTILNYIQKDLFIILVCLITILGCMYTLYTVESYKQDCNNYWESFINDSPCFKGCIDKSFNLYNVDFEWGGIYED